MNRRKFLSIFSVFCLSLILAISCSQAPKVTDTEKPTAAPGAIPDLLVVTQKLRLNFP